MNDELVNPYRHDHNPLNEDITGGICSACEWDRDHRPVAVVRPVDDHGNVYSALAFVCPGCALMPGGGSGLHMLPVNSPNKSPQWDWDGNLAAPSLSPSILTRGADSHRCHSFLRGGVFEFLTDSTHPLAGQSVPLPPLPDWMVNRG